MVPFGGSISLSTQLVSLLTPKTDKVHGEWSFVRSALAMIR